MKTQQRSWIQCFGYAAKVAVGLVLLLSQAHMVLAQEQDPYLDRNDYDRYLDANSLEDDPPLPPLPGGANHNSDPSAITTNNLVNGTLNTLDAYTRLCIDNVDCHTSGAQMATMFWMFGLFDSRGGNWPAPFGSTQGKLVLAICHSPPPYGHLVSVFPVPWSNCWNPPAYYFPQSNADANANVASIWDAYDIEGPAPTYNGEGSTGLNGAGGFDWNNISDEMLQGLHDTESCTPVTQVYCGSDIGNPVDPFDPPPCDGINGEVDCQIN